MLKRMGMRWFTAKVPTKNPAAHWVQRGILLRASPQRRGSLSDYEYPMEAPAFAGAHISLMTSQSREQ